jgi:DNA-binding NarL/FixJ family response regulator
MVKYPIRLSIFEDNNNLRRSLEQLFSFENDFMLKGAFADCSNIVAHINEVHPDMVLMDINMPGINGIEGVKKALAIDAEIKIIMFTVFEEDNMIFEALKAGAKGYLLKKTSNEKLLTVLKDIYEGATYMSPGIAAKVLASFSNVPKKEPKETYHLTTRELEVLNHLAAGLSYKMIASTCDISMNTVRTHIKRIYEKLQVNSNTEAINKITGYSGK